MTFLTQQTTQHSPHDSRVTREGEVGTESLPLDRGEVRRCRWTGEREGGRGREEEEEAGGRRGAGTGTAAGNGEARAQPHRRSSSEANAGNGEP
ncbi:hypothetical protein ACLOJK_013991 [Asimina triloba]